MLLWRNSNAAATLDALGRSHAVVEFDPTGVLLSANASFLETLGYELEEIKGRHHSIFVDAEHRNTAEYTAFWDELRDGKARAGEFLRLAKGDRRVWIQASYNPILDRAGKVVRIVALATEITVRKVRSLDLDAQMAALDKSQAVIAFTPDGIVLDANANFLSTVGYAQDEVHGRHHRMFVDPREQADDGLASRKWRALFLKEEGSDGKPEADLYA